MRSSFFGIVLRELGKEDDKSAVQFLRL